MKYASLFLALLVWISACKKETPRDCSAGPSAQYFAFNGVNREYLLYKPAGLPAHAPLVFVLHGYLENAQMFYSMGFNPIADTALFAVCYPQGIDCDWDRASHNSNDILFLKALAAHLQTEHNLSPTRTFATGFSAGGAICNLLALDAGDVFHAIAPVAGNIKGNLWSAKNPQFPVPAIVMHGVDDHINPIEGGGDDLSPTTQDQVDYWKNLNQCTTSSQSAFNANTTRWQYGAGLNGHEVWYYRITGFGHDWPGQSNGAGFDACAEIWNFFRRF